MNNSANTVVTTVVGPLPVEQLGVTLPHEHLFIDLRNQFRECADPQKQAMSRQQITLANVGVLRRNPYAIEDNLLLDEYELAVKEAGYFRQAGGNTIIDCTSIGIQRAAERLRALARATDLTIIAGCGYYLCPYLSIDRFLIDNPQRLLQ